MSTESQEMYPKKGARTLIAMLYKMDAEEKKKEQQPEVNSGPAPLPSEVNPPITRADFKGDE